MKRTHGLFLVFVALGSWVGGPALGADVPDLPYLEVSFATEGPLSLFSIPDGTGNPLTLAFDQNGQLVDGTLTIQFFDSFPPWGNPVPYFPREDIWLMDLDDDLVLCPSGTIPDSDTDMDGRTTFTGPFFLGGHVEPGGGNEVVFFINGWVLDSPALAALRFNSADLDGDLSVNLTDIYLFTQAYYGPYEYSADFRWDGVVNLSDLAFLASSVGANCP